MARVEGMSVKRRAASSGVGVLMKNSSSSLLTQVHVVKELTSAKLIQNVE